MYGNKGGCTFYFGIIWSEICVVQHKCAMIVMAEGYVDSYFFIFLFFFCLKGCYDCDGRGLR